MTERIARYAAAGLFVVLGATLIGGCSSESDGRDAASGCTVCGLNIDGSGSCTAEGQTGPVSARDSGGDCVLTDAGGGTVTLHCDGTTTISSGETSYDGTWTNSANTVSVSFLGGLVSMDCTF